MFYYELPGKTAVYATSMEMPSNLSVPVMDLPVVVPFVLDGKPQTMRAATGIEAYWIATAIATAFDVEFDHTTECGVEIKIRSIKEQLRYAKYAPELSTEYEHLKMCFINNLGYWPIWLIPMILNRKQGAKTYATWSLAFGTLIRKDVALLNRVRPGAGDLFSFEKIDGMAFVNC